MNTSFLVGILLLTICLVGVLLWGQMVRRSKRSRFGNRKELTTDELLAAFGKRDKEQSEEILSLLTSIAESMEINVGVLRPEDRIGEEIGPAKGWEYDDSTVLVLRDFLSKIPEGTSAPKDLRELVDLVCGGGTFKRSENRNADSL